MYLSYMSEFYRQSIYNMYMCIYTGCDDNKIPAIFTGPAEKNESSIEHLAITTAVLPHMQSDKCHRH